MIFFFYKLNYLFDHLFFFFFQPIFLMQIKGAEVADLGSCLELFICLGRTHFLAL